jgi:hypothetical protein
MRGCQRESRARVGWTWNVSGEKGRVGIKRRRVWWMDVLVMILCRRVGLLLEYGRGDEEKKS